MEKERITTTMTKRALAASLKKLMNQKALDKISIREIVEDCGVNRKTFYYHFTNIYDLLNWMFEDEAIEPVRKYDYLTEYDEVVRFAINYVEENEHVVSSAINALGRDELKKFFYNNFIENMRKIVDDISKEMVIPEDYKDFLIDFYTDSFASLLTNWTHNKDKNDKEKYIEYISITLFEGIRPDLERTHEHFANK
ncbi:TetR/AcrR family transcriptional regulator C-terminal domain-containing protein [Facklamia miroungae]|uniref:Probable dihydroxyacetone kinase regulator n=1 Tax=Facklamia miroungae TaxID=120956 RepID=A0A1G7UVL9_9LACT|nr:TetR/AcrR family transcriptional regulator C-terminal domain-containing protein [Facklamia miroungae]NKZ30138.1 TetR family transcriptional regulator [Facklamia miroungae]SDG51514.1 probable dihydroxyacetone kinase regulator [Facklamia miroungae]